MSTPTITPLSDLLRDRDNASSPGIKASLTKKINSHPDTKTPTVPSSSTLRFPEKVTPRTFSTMVRLRETMTPDNSTTGERAAITRHIREMSVILDRPDPTVKVEKITKKGLRDLKVLRESTVRAGEKASLTRKINRWESVLKSR